MMKRVWMVVCLLLVATLACTWFVDEDKDDAIDDQQPPDVATAVPGQTPTVSDRDATPLGGTSNESGGVGNNDGPRISIGSPVEGQEVSVQGFRVSGQEIGSFEHNVVVQALDSNGNVLEETATTAVGELGQLSDWAVTLTPDVEPGTPGRIRAFFTSADDGRVIAEMEVNVQYVE